MLWFLCWICQLLLRAVLASQIDSNQIWCKRACCWKMSQTHLLGCLWSRWCGFSERFCASSSLAQSCFEQLTHDTWCLQEISQSLSGARFWNPICSRSWEVPLDGANDLCPSILCKSFLGISDRTKCSFEDGIRNYSHPLWFCQHFN